MDSTIKEVPTCTRGSFSYSGWNCHREITKNTMLSLLPKRKALPVEVWLTMLAVWFLVAHETVADSIDEALEQAAETGRPIFVVAINKGAGSAKFLARLKTDKSLDRYMELFIPLKIRVQTKEWNKWAGRFQYQAGERPILYVVRADGKQLYGKAGPHRGNELTQMLELVLGQAGTIYDDQQISVITEAVAGAKQALKEGDTAAAVRKLAVIQKFGMPGSLGSYARPAVACDELVKKLLEQAFDELTNAAEQLRVREKGLDGALAVATIQQTYQPLKELDQEITKVIARLKANRECRELIDQARSLEQARVWMASPTKRGRAVPILERVILKAPDSPAADRASKWLREEFPGDADAIVIGISSRSGSNSAQPTTRIELEGVHTWTSLGGHSIESKMVDYYRDKETNGLQIVLVSRNGGQIAVPYEKLDEASQRLANRIIHARKQSHASSTE